ncbi:MAG: hypothetical protein DWQ06_10290 [Calditrichaeota bacterium]|nr:MAG: hypothetical protein DWQ06_10290 [Calditrichota bacterium]
MSELNPTRVKIERQGELLDKLKEYKLRLRNRYQLTKYEDGIFFEKLLEGYGKEGLRLSDFDNRELVMAYNKLKNGSSIEELKIKS